MEIFFFFEAYLLLQSTKNDKKDQVGWTQRNFSTSFR